MRTVIGVVLLAVPVKDGVGSSDGDAGGFNVTLGAAASAVNITGETTAPPAINTRLIARRAATVTSRRAVNALIRLPPFHVSERGRTAASSTKLGKGDRITYEPRHAIP